jgi:hypothetical protein
MTKTTMNTKAVEALRLVVPYDNQCLRPNRRRLRR